MTLIEVNVHLIVCISGRVPFLMQIIIKFQYNALSHWFKQRAL